MNVVEKYGGTSVGTIAQIKAVAAHAAKLKAVSGCCQRR